MNRKVLRALLTVFSAMLFTAHTLVALPTAHGTKSVLGGPTYSIGAAKSITSIVPQPNGSYNISYVVVVKNYGTGALSNVQATDNLSITFPNPVTFTIVTAPVASGTLTANAGYNGNGNINLLTSASSTLAAGAQETITFTVNVSAQGAGGTFYNTALVAGTDANGGIAVADSSDWGTNPDSNLNGIPTEQGENTPTPTILSTNLVTSVGVAKTIVDTTVTNCVYDITYNIVVRNLGNEPLNNIQVTDDLVPVFPSPATYSVSNVSVSGGNLILGGTTYDGTTTTTFLNSSASSLGIGQTAVISYTVSVNFNSSCGTFNNQATVTAQGQFSSTATTDLSDWGTNPDPDLDGNANENPLENNPTPFKVECPDVQIAKAAGAPVLQPDGSYNVTYTVTLTNNSSSTTNVTVLDDLSLTFPSPVTYTFVNNPAGTGGLVPNLNYGTGSDWNLLDNSSTINGNSTETVTFTVNVLLNNTTDTLFFNSAIATALGSCGTTAVDTSNNGTDTSTPGAVPTPVVLLPTITLIPGGFSPNGDGKNDLFVLTNIGGKKVKVQIFNRWGAVVYKNDSYDNSWNGTANTGFGLGEDLPTGTYWYIISIDDTKKVTETANYLTLTR